MAGVLLTKAVVDAAEKLKGGGADFIDFLYAAHPNMNSPD
jgi:hypothetical protein